MMLCFFFFLVKKKMYNCRFEMLKKFKILNVLVNSCLRGKCLLVLILFYSNCYK